MTPDSSLAASAASPFALLAALEARLTASGEARGYASAGAQWTGLGFILGDGQYLAPQAEVREVLEVPAATRVPGAKSWLVGIANLRGNLLPVVDLGRLLGRSEAVRSQASRVVVVNDEELATGFLVDGVRGFRGFALEHQRHELVDVDSGAGFDAAATDFLLGAFVRDGDTWRVFSLAKLSRDARFRDAGA